MKNVSFKTYLTSKGKEDLSSSLSGALESMHAIIEEMEHMRSQSLSNAVESLVSKFRQILSNNSFVSKKENQYLKKIQQIAVALSKSLESGEDVKQTLRQCTEELEFLLHELGEPINHIAVQERPKVPPKNNVSGPVD